jgi:hypothetical protein
MHFKISFFFFWYYKCYLFERNMTVHIGGFSSFNRGLKAVSNRSRLRTLQKRPFTYLRSMNTTELLRTDQMPGNDYATYCRKKYSAAGFSYSILHSVAENNLFKSKWKVIEDWKKCHNRNLNNLNASSNASRMQNQRTISGHVM